MRRCRHLFFNIILLSHLFLFGQDVTIELTTTPSTCFANGTITITLKGSDVGQLSQIAYTAIHKTTQDSYVSINPIIENLPKGEYSVIMDAYYQNTTPFQKTGTTTIGGNYTAPTAFKVGNSELIGTRKTLNCRNTGRVSMEITGGVFPYIVETYLNASLLKRDTFNTFQNSGTDINMPDYKNYYNIENLPSGNFTFKIKDGCNYGLPDITEVVGKVSEDFHCTSITISPTDNVNHYNTVNINFGENIGVADDLYKYFYDHLYRNILWWEYTYSFDGEPEKVWKNIPTAWKVMDTVASASKYCDIWSKSYQIKIRVKGCSGNTCNTTRKISYSGNLNIFSQNIFDPVTGCADKDKIKVYLNFHSGNMNEYCTAPISYKIMDITSGQVLADNSINARGWSWETTMSRSKIDDMLHILVNDKFNCQLYNSNAPIPPPPDYNWHLAYYNRICNSSSDYDLISWSWNECLNSYFKPPDNSKIELVESPNANYYHFVATYNRNQDKWSISQDNSSGFTVSTDGSCIIRMQGKDLLSGTYKWHISDCCERNDANQAEYKFYNYVIEEPFSFGIDVTCEGKSYLPKVKLVAKEKGGTQIVAAPVHYQVSGVPGGFSPSSGVCNIDKVTLTRPGNYQMSFNHFGNNITCLIPSKSMNYNPNSLALKNVYGYACDDGVNKVIKVVVNVDSTTGMAPYKFEIFKENGEYITSNTSGIFYNIGAPDTTLLVNITDQCGAFIQYQKVKITNLQSGAKVAFADDTIVCLGGNIRLHGISVVGAQMGYNWTGPDEFASQSKDPVINYATLKHEGDYILTISGLECLIKDNIYITILPPDTGFIEDFICRGISYKNYGFDIEPLDVPDTTYIFYRSDLKTDTYRCDSTACLFLTVRDYAFFSIEPVGEVCADEPYFILPCNFYNEQKVFYNIVFNDTALQQGFQNVDSGIIAHTQYLEITLPHGIDKQDYVMPSNHYSASVFVNNGRCNSRVYNFPIQISYPNWITEQKWNDVIALLNDRYNGGYLFSKYEWYKNGEKLDGETGSYVYLLPNLDFDAEYRALVTRVSDGEAVFTCPLKPAYRPGMKVYPQLASKNEPVFIETQQPGTAIIWNLLGQKIAQESVFENQINKIYVNKTGFFIVEIVTNNDLRETFKIIVR